MMSSVIYHPQSSQSYNTGLFIPVLSSDTCKTLYFNVMMLAERTILITAHYGGDVFVAVLS